jgi:monoamine oxidase
VLNFLGQEGALSSSRTYLGSPRRGYATLPGAGLQPGTTAEPYAFEALIQAGFGSYFSQDYDFQQQMTMFQIVGGTDRLAQAFVQRVEDTLEYEATVREIRQRPNGVRIIYEDAAGEEREIWGDFCICTIPLPVLATIPSDFSTQMKAAIRAVSYMPTGKIGLQFSRRFWEEDEQIFGGISRTNLNIGQIWYPSSGYLSKKGILVGYYNFAGEAVSVGNLSPQARTTHALEQGRKLHPQYDDTFETAFSVSWHKIPYTRGGWAFYSDLNRQRDYPLLNQPQGNIYLAGEHLSYLTGWMAGAFVSAQQVVSTIHQRVLSQG